MNKPITPKDQLLGKDDSEIQQEIQERQKILTERQMSKLQEGDVIVKIKEFMNPLVKPFACGIRYIIGGELCKESDGRALYEVFNWNTKQTVMHHGGHIVHLFGKDENERIKFAQKELGDNISLKWNGVRYEIRFLYFEYPIPRRELEVFAKNMGEKPKDILLGTPKEVLYPAFSVTNDEDEEKRLILEERKLRLKEKEIELVEREKALVKGKVNELPPVNTGS